MYHVEVLAIFYFYTVSSKRLGQFLWDCYRLSVQANIARCMLRIQSAVGNAPSIGRTD